MWWLIFITVALAVAGLFHALIREYIIASILSAIVATVLLQVIVYIQLGYLDPFFLIGIICGGVYYFAAALIVGIPFWFYRRRDRSGFCVECGYNLTGNISGVCPECGNRIRFDHL